MNQYLDKRLQVFINTSHLISAAFSIKNALILDTKSTTKQANVT